MKDWMVWPSSDFTDVIVPFHLPDQDVPTSMRLGVHTGPCVSGIIGTSNLRFCLFGDTIDGAHSLEETGLAGAIHASQIVKDLVPGENWVLHRRAKEKNKTPKSTGKGGNDPTIAQTYLLTPIGPEAAI